jgi:hypothetical protein
MRTLKNSPLALLVSVVLLALSRHVATSTSDRWPVSDQGGNFETLSGKRRVLARKARASTPFLSLENLSTGIAERVADMWNSSDSDFNVARLLSKFVAPDVSRTDRSTAMHANHESTAPVP